MRLSVVLLTIVALMVIAVMPLHIALAQQANPTRILPDSVQRGETFNVTVTFTSPANGFDFIYLFDVAPDGWTVIVDGTWCIPNATAHTTGNKSVITLWGGPYDNGTAFTAVYKVTVPHDAQLGIYSFAGMLRYYLGSQGPYGENITGDSQVELLTEKPTANFTVDDNATCVNTSVNFTDLSTPIGEIDSWSWDFGDGNNSADPNPSHQYSTVGTYSVSLTVENVRGNDTETKTNYITVSAPPIANFTVDDNTTCVNTSVNFIDLSTGDPTSWSWDFGDGNNSTDPNPTHQYSDAGTYNVSLTVENVCGNDTETKTNYITVSASPIANFTVDDNTTCVNTSVNFTDLSTGDPTSWSWDFGDGNNSTDPNPTHQYSDAGIYNVSLTVENECGNDTETKTNYITVKAAPVAKFSTTPTPPTGYAPLTVNFTDNSTGNPTDWTWDFPGGSPPNATGQGPHTVTYNSVGTYTASLNVINVTNDCGSDTTTATVTVLKRGGGGSSGPGGGSGGGSRYLEIDILGKITRVRISYATSGTFESVVVSDFNNTNFLEIERGTTVICDDTNKPPKVLVMRVAKESPPVPDGSVIIGSVYDFTGNYSSSSCGYRGTPYCCSSVSFDQNITIVLSYDPNELPESTASLAVAYYDIEQGSWVSLPTDIGRVAEVGKATGLISHISAVAIIAELAPAPAPASFVPSALNIEQSPQVWKNIFVGVTGNDVTITANVANNGGQESTYIAELKLNGERVDAKEVTLATGQSQQVTFTLSGMDYGQYEVEVAGLSGEFTVSQTIDWWAIFGIILAVGLITWGAIRWIKRKKPAQPAQKAQSE